MTNEKQAKLSGKVKIQVGSCENCGYDYTKDNLEADMPTGAVKCPKCGKDSFNWD